MEDPMNTTLTWTHASDDEVHHFYRVDDFGAGELEPVAVRKWTDGDAMYVWEQPQQDETDLMFFWDGFHLMGVDPQPIWFFIGEDYCKFSIGEQYGYDPEATGTCELNEETGTGVLTFNNAPYNDVVLNTVDDFGWAGAEPQAVQKWSNGDLFIWKRPPRSETPFMFYWIGYGWLDWEP